LPATAIVVFRNTHKRISDWQPSFYYIFGKVFGEKYKLSNICFIQCIPNILNETSLKCDHGNKLKVKG